MTDSHIPPARNGSYPVRGGNLLAPLVDGDVAFARICAAVAAAKKSVWLTIAYLDPAFHMPDGRSLFDVLDQAQARGLDVRAIIWRTDNKEELLFNGTEAEREWLGDRGSRFLIRWDRAHKYYCQHQKTWLMDAGAPDEVAFVGGINLDAASVSPVGHAGRAVAQIHDVYCELRGPCASDVQHNFVQRWNEASERTREDGVWPDLKSQTQLEFPKAPSPAAGKSRVQIQRTVHAGMFTDGTAAPDAAPFDIAKGESSVFEQYGAAIDAAKSSIYIEDQYIAAPAIVAKLAAALARGVDVVYLAPADPETRVREARTKAEAKPFFDALAALGKFENFLLAGIAAKGADGKLRNVYVHAKIMLVDDAWGTIGSTNIATQSFYCDTEMNASFWDAVVARDLRTRLFAEHLATDTSAMDDRTALKIYREIARANVQARERGEEMQGLAFALDPARYGL
ncbi:MAG TPA: phospholipase D family protein [Rhizomicrobium sp.]|jgi:phosphatidylserine/phosphatidylglycerophosphate/cardiolipin synthase-like enzyme|nr:phospholipase D family protein [Rhizomicrobium sp.]